MNTKKTFTFLGAAAAVLTSPSASATFGINLATTQNDNSATLAIRLYNSNLAPLDASESADPLILVFDRSTASTPSGAAGVVRAPDFGNTYRVLYDNTDATPLPTMDDVLASILDSADYVRSLTVNSLVQGRTSQNVTGLPSDLQIGGTGSGDFGGTPIANYTLLFDSNDFADQAGSFGLHQNFVAGSLPTAGAGNAPLRIGEDVFANQYVLNFVAVPEPSSAAFAAVALGGYFLWRRRVSRA